jgi:hypothetical protein
MERRHSIRRVDADSYIERRAIGSALRQKRRRSTGGRSEIGWYAFLL